MATTDVRVHPSPAPQVSARGSLLPRTALGLASLVLAFSVGAALSGAVLFSYYQFRKDQTDKYIQGFDKRFNTAIDTINAEGETAKSEIRAELEPLKKIRAEGETLEALLKQVQESVWFVRTLDEAGQPSVGSAFVVASDSGQSMLLAAYHTVRASTVTPGPGVVLRKGEEELRANVWTWHEERDLALLVVEKGDLKKLEFAPRDPPLRVGERVFAVSGLGGAGGAITQGFIADVSGAGIQHDAAVGPSFQGGPLVNSQGQAIAIASRAYDPLNFRTEGVYFAVPARAACDKVLRCPGGDIRAGARR